MKFNPKSATLAVIGFVCGLLVMYIALLSSVHPLGGTSQFVDRLNNTKMETMLLRVFERKMLRNNTHKDMIQCSTSQLGPGCLEHDTSIQSRTGHDTLGSTWDDQQKHRRHRISETCRNLRRPKLKSSELRDLLADNSNIYVDDKHQILFCSIPKAACSSWKFALAMLTNVLPKGKLVRGNIHSQTFMKRIGLVSPSHLNATHLRLVLDNYTKIIVVRHPFERLLSAYRDKFVVRNKWSKFFQSRYGRKIVLLYRGQNVSVRSLRKGHDVTFKEFLTFLVDDTVPEKERFNPHWDTYQQLCHPCEIEYQHVIKFDTMEQDNALILRRYFSVDNYTQFFPKRNMKVVPSGDLVPAYYAKIPLDLIYRIYNFFQIDMKMFGYDLPPSIVNR
ncbi:hypothetical protein LSH36_501g07036 [Paralvinella palmiformis]|uniref:Carbohydrate sulfotransferase n=1 Tax=Paralvinella palmiformis TaxID=53620 RepID=A0AAD9J8E5_9ANNE|nr:hypothetical protein LSH36_501g07036 [Paralvinella palmiformis]